MNNRWTTHLGIFLAVLLSLAGLAVSAVLVQHHIAIEVGGEAPLSQVCDARTYLSCDEVLSSRWGRFQGLPTALWGFFFFAAVGAWYLAVGRPAGSRRWLHLLPLLATAGGTAGCAFFAYIMYATLPRWCPLCTTTHVLTLLLFVVTVLLWPRKPAGGAPVIPYLQASQVGSPLTVAVAGAPSGRAVLVALVLAAVACLAGWSEYHRRLEKAYAAEYRQRWAGYEEFLAPLYQQFMAQPQVDLPLKPEDPIRGDVDAPHTIVVYSDFLCPWCRTLAQMLDARMKDYPGRFRVVFRHFPMDDTCNKTISRTLHRGACAAAVIAEAARVVGGSEAFWKMHDALFDDQKGFASGPQAFARGVAERIGLDVEAFWTKATRSTATWDRVNANVVQAAELGVKSTPAIFFDGRHFEKYYGNEHFWRYFFWLEDQDKRPPGFRDTTLKSVTGSDQPTTAPATGPASLSTSPDTEPAVDHASTPDTVTE